MTTEVERPDLTGKAEAFGQELASLLNGVLFEVPDIDVLSLGPRYVIRPAGGGKISLSIRGQRLASLAISLRCCLDSAERYLAVERSEFVLYADLDRTPVIRFDYRRDMYRAPCAHIQVHAHRGALSHLLSRAGHPTPHDMSALHLPVGGARFRPCLEDLLQLLIEECGFDHKEGWQQHVESGRERWRRRQVAAAVRAAPSEAVRVLRDLGYGIEPPTEPRADSLNALRRW